MRAKLLTALLAGAVVSASLSMPAAAATYICPPPSQINCVPATMTVGPWQHNGGQMTGNTFMPNNQCANVINTGPMTQRLVCCYTKCGVFIQDVNARMCRKVSERAFECR
jgi:hypothetical protein